MNPEDDLPIEKVIPTFALAEGVTAAMTYCVLPGGGVFISRGDIVDFLTLAACLEAADIIRQIGPEPL